jgi:hypothetical protein
MFQTDDHATEVEHMAGELATMAELSQADSVPRWAWKLIARLAKLERGQVYRLTLVMDGTEPTWALEPVGRLENWRA